MGWCHGSEVMNGIIAAFKTVNIDAKDRAELYKLIVPILEDQDWDTVDESFDKDDVFDAVIHEMYPEWFEDEEGEEYD